MKAAAPVPPSWSWNSIVICVIAGFTEPPLEEDCRRGQQGVDPSEDALIPGRGDRERPEQGERGRYQQERDGDGRRAAAPVATPPAQVAGEQSESTEGGARPYQCGRDEVAEQGVGYGVLVAWVGNVGCEVHSEADP